MSDLTDAAPEKDITPVGERRAPGALRTFNQALAGAVGTVTVTTLLVGWLRSQANVLEVGSVYLLSVLALGSVAGRLSAVMAAVLSFLAVNFFFVEPIFTLHVANPREWLTLTILLVTAIISGQLTAALRDRARDSERRRTEIAFLHELGQRLGQRGPLDERIADALSWLAESRSMSRDQVSLVTTDGKSIVPQGSESHPVNDPMTALEYQTLENGSLATRGWRLADHQWVPLEPGDVALPSLGTLWVPLLVSDTLVGTLMLDRCVLADALRSDWRRLMLAAASLLAQTIERDRLTTMAMETEVLQRADALKSALLSSVSHDLRTPLASIKASISTLQDPNSVLADNDRRDLLEGMGEETDRLTRYVTHLLELSRLESGAAVPKLEWYEPGEIVWEVADALDPGGNRLHMEIPDSVPMVQVDFVMVVQILTNLVENALRYSDAGVDVTVDTADSRLRICVSDRGPGVADGDRDHIFEKFFRADGQARGKSGAGVGLSVARGLAQAHGGDVRYEPRAGGGSTFVLDLPIESQTEMVKS